MSSRCCSRGYCYTDPVLSNIDEIDADGAALILQRSEMHFNNSVAVDLPARLNFRLRSGTVTCCPRAVTELYPTLEQVEFLFKKVQGDDSGESW